ncbi:MAG: Gfo/Idh/MocA family oxidoreductase [Ruminococcus sp.]|nr:Gfo/Idh/MocA family oxidoreductase [Ruminococcus sp.]
MVNIGIMGAGNISRALCRAAAVTEGIQVVAVAARDMKRAQAFATEMGIPRCYGSYAQLLSDMSVDVVYIGTTTDLHYNCIKMSLAAGKHVLCEKALVETEARAEECFALAGRHRVLLMEAMWSRFLPKTEKVREWVTEGRIGKVTAVQATIGNYIEKDMNNRFYSPALGGGAMFDLGVYAIDLMGYFACRRITDWSGQVLRAESGVDETVSLYLDLDGVPAQALITFNAAVPQDCWICGEKGMIRVPNMHWGSEAFLLDPSGKELERYSKPEENGMRFELMEVVRILGEGAVRSEIASPEMTLLSSRIYDSILTDKSVTPTETA